MTSRFECIIWIQRLPKCSVPGDDRLRPIKPGFMLRHRIQNMTILSLFVSPSSQFYVAEPAVYGASRPGTRDLTSHNSIRISYSFCDLPPPFGRLRSTPLQKKSARRTELELRT